MPIRAGARLSGGNNSVSSKNAALQFAYCIYKLHIAPIIGLGYMAQGGLRRARRRSTNALGGMALYNKRLV